MDGTDIPAASTDPIGVRRLDEGLTGRGCPICGAPPRPRRKGSTGPNPKYCEEHSDPAHRLEALRLRQAGRTGPPTASAPTAAGADARDAHAVLLRGGQARERAGELLSELLALAPALTDALAAGRDTDRVAREIADARERVHDDAENRVREHRRAAEEATAEAEQAKRDRGEAIALADAGAANVEIMRVEVDKAHTAEQRARSQALLLPPLLVAAATTTRAALARAADLERDLHDERAAHQTSGETANRHERERDQARDELKKRSVAHKDLTKAHTALGLRAAADRATVDAQKTTLTERTNERDQARTELTKLREEHATLTDTAGEQRGRLKAMQSRLDHQAMELTTREGEIKTLRDRLATANEETVRLTGARQAATGRAEQAEHDLKTADGRIAGLERRLAALQPPPAPAAREPATPVLDGQMAIDVPADAPTPPTKANPPAKAPEGEAEHPEVPKEVYDDAARAATRLDARRGRAAKLPRKVKNALTALAQRRAKPFHWDELLAVDPLGFGATETATDLAAALDRLRAHRAGVRPPAHTRPAPDLAPYDTLLTLPTQTPAATGGAGGEAEARPWDAVPSAMYEEIHLAARRVNPKAGRAADLPEATKAALRAVASDSEPSPEHLTVLLMRHGKEFGTTEHAKRLARALVELHVALTVASSVKGRAADL